jgi:hypothetical protein
MAKKKKLKMAPRRPEEEAYLKRWANAKSAPTLWEKLDTDLAFERSAKIRGEISPGSLGKSWGKAKSTK